MFESQATRPAKHWRHRAVKRLATKGCILLGLSFALSFAAQAEAAPIPLVEITHEKQPRFGGIGSPPVRDWEFWLSASLAPDGNPAVFEWFESYTFDDIGKSFFAPPEVVSGAAKALVFPPATYRILTAGPSDPVQGRLIDWSTSDQCNPCATVFVSDLTAYEVSAVERVIDNLVIESTGFGTWIGGGKQTIRFWGEPIPEPDSVALLLILAGTLWSAWRRRRTAPSC